MQRTSQTGEIKVHKLNGPFTHAGSRHQQWTTYRYLSIHHVSRTLLVCWHSVSLQSVLPARVAQTQATTLVEHARESGCCFHRNLRHGLFRAAGSVALWPAICGM